MLHKTLVIWLKHADASSDVSWPFVWNRSGSEFISIPSFTKWCTAFKPTNSCKDLPLGNEQNPEHDRYYAVRLPERAQALLRIILRRLGWRRRRTTTTARIHPSAPPSVHMPTYHNGDGNILQIAKRHYRIIHIVLDSCVHCMRCVYFFTPLAFACDGKFPFDFHCRRVIYVRKSKKSSSCD